MNDLGILHISWAAVLVSTRIFLTSFSWVEQERGTVDAEAFPGGCGTVTKHMAQVSVALGARHLCADHTWIGDQ